MHITKDTLNYLRYAYHNNLKGEVTRLDHYKFALNATNTVLVIGKKAEKSRKSCILKNGVLS